jgi:AraC-like DNA-binding protein
MTPSTDFASAAMLRLIQLGLQQQGLVTNGLVTQTSQSSHRKPSGARVALEDKRKLVDQLHQSFGSVALLRMGEAIHSAPDEPALLALSMAGDPFDLIARWQRLERFVHSRHRVDIEVNSAVSMQLHHRSLDSAQAPSPGEDLLIFGLLVALLNRMGTARLRARFVGERSWQWNRVGWRDATTHTDTARWQIEWAVGCAANTKAESETPSPTPAQPELKSSSNQTATAATALLTADPGRAWNVASLAQELATSPRQLQRQLQAQRLTFSALLSQARVTQAAQRLVAAPQSAAEIGYACGYADQAHFNREFKRHTAFTPLAYRQHFAA